MCLLLSDRWLRVDEGHLSPALDERTRRKRLFEWWACVYSREGNIFFMRNKWWCGDRPLRRPSSWIFLVSCHMLVACRHQFVAYEISRTCLRPSLKEGYFTMLIETGGTKARDEGSRRKSHLWPICANTGPTNHLLAILRHVPPMALALYGTSTYRDHQHRICFWSNETVGVHRFEYSLVVLLVSWWK